MRTDAEIEHINEVKDDLIMIIDSLNDSKMADCASQFTKSTIFIRGDAYINGDREKTITLLE